jgi:hypothetical protein
MLQLFNFSFHIPYYLIDKGFIELFGPEGIIYKVRRFSFGISQVQSGFIYQYTFLILVGIFFYFNLVFSFLFLKDLFSLDYVLFSFFFFLSFKLK